VCSFESDVKSAQRPRYADACGSGRTAETGCDLLVGELLEHAQLESGPLLLGQCLERLSDLDAPRFGDEPTVGVLDLPAVRPKGNAQALTSGRFDAALTQVGEKQVLRDSVQPRADGTGVGSKAAQVGKRAGERLGCEIESGLLVSNARSEPPMYARGVTDIEAEKCIRILPGCPDEIGISRNHSVTIRGDDENVTVARPPPFLGLAKPGLFLR
jgi:hypothetical protein